MKPVTYGQSGYIGRSMSVRAAQAYSDGEKPLYKWTKKAAIDAIKEYCNLFDLKFDDKIESLSKKELISQFVEYKSWHHSGAYLKETEFYGLNEDAVCAVCPEMSPEEIAERDEKVAARVEADADRKAYRQERESEFEVRFGCHPSSVKAYEAIHPDMCRRFVSRKGTECIAYRLPQAAVDQGMKEEQVSSVEYSANSRVGCFSAFRTLEGRTSTWHDVDMDELQDKFDAVAERYGEKTLESLDEMMSAKSTEAEIGQDAAPDVAQEIGER